MASQHGRKPPKPPVSRSSHGRKPPAPPPHSNRGGSGCPLELVAVPFVALVVFAKYLMGRPIRTMDVTTGTYSLLTKRSGTGNKKGSV